MSQRQWRWAFRSRRQRSNYAPDCNLTDSGANGDCGAFANQNFGRSNPNATRYDPAILSGFGVRPASWDYTVELQQQVGSGVSVSGGYYHTERRTVNGEPRTENGERS